MNDILTPQTPEERPAEEQGNIQPEGSVSLPDTFTAQDIKQYFQLAPYMDSDAINYLTSYFASRGVVSKGDVFQLLKDTELRIGQVGGDRLTNIYNYLKVQSQIDDLYKVKNSMEYGIRQ